MKLIIPLVILALLAMIYLSSSISKPLHAMIEKLQRVGKHESLQFDEESEAEFRYLSKSIEQKHNELLHLNLTLESAVEKKTQELQRLNESLEQKVAEAVKDVKSKEQMLQQQARLAQMGEMISMIAHQWRQPLAAITSAMMVVERNIEIRKHELSTKKGKEDFFHFLEEKHEEINENIQYLSTTTEDFRNFFNPHTEKELVSIDEPVKKALKLIQSSMHNKGIVIESSFESTKRCELYSNEVMQVLLNILKNASDALTEMENRQKTVWIRTYDLEGKPVIEVCDNGAGIPEKNIEKIFDPYFTTKGEKIGTGLGLYMAKNIIEEHHNGKIEIVAKEGNTCFRLCLGA